MKIEKKKPDVKKDSKVSKKQQQKPKELDLLHKFIRPVDKVIPFETVTDEGIIITPYKTPNQKQSFLASFLNAGTSNAPKEKRYSIVVKFEDFNYQMLGDEARQETVAKYAQFLNFFDSTINVQILILNKAVDPREVYEKVKVKSSDYPEYAEDYNKVLLGTFSESSALFSQEKYLVLSVSAYDLRSAKNILEKLLDDVIRHFQSLGSQAYVLSGVQVVKLMHDLFIEDEPIDLSGRENHLFARRAKDIVSPSSLYFKRNQLIINETNYVSFLYLKDYPPILSDRLLYSVLNAGVECIVNIHMHPMPQQEAISLATKALMQIEAAEIDSKKSAMKSGVVDYVPLKLQRAEAEAKAIISDLRDKGMRLFVTTVSFMVKGKDEEELKINIDKIKRAVAEYSGIVAPLTAYQELAFSSFYPLAMNYIPIDRLLNTANVAVFIPFTTKNYFDEHGFYYGMNMLSNLPVIFDRRSLRNPNGFILGTPGSGKSFSAKREIVEVLLNTNDDIVVIDPEREYENLANAFRGTDIKISNGSPHHINPLDINENYSDVSEEDPISFKSDFVISMFGAVLKDISNIKKSILDRSVRIVYQKAKEKGTIPTLQDLYTVLQMQPEPEAKYFAIEIELFVKGSLALFSHPTNIDVQNRFVVYDIKDLGSELKTLGMFVTLDQIWNRITVNRESRKRTWIFIDEIYLLFQNPYAQDFLFKLFKRARKWGAIITGITQNVEDLLRSEQARTMLANTDFLILLNQSPTDRIILQELLHLSEKDVRYITSSPPGQGIISIDHTFIPIRDKFPVDSKLYKIMTTKFGES